MTQQKIALFLGPSLDPPFEDKKIPIIRYGHSFENIGHCDNVILYGHGEVNARNTAKETHKTQLLEYNSSSTIEQVLKVMKITTPEHIDLVSCYGGALGEDIQKKENFDQLVALMRQNNQKDFTISVFSSSKHPTSSYVVAPYMDAIASLEASTDPGMQRVGLMRNFPETLKQYNIHIDDKGQASLVSFKIRSPKSSNEIEHPEQFIGSHASYGSKVENKKTRQISQIVTEIGQDNVRHDELLDKIRAELLKGGATFNEEYIQHAATLSATREKLNLMEKWVGTLSDDQTKTIAVNTIMRQQINFENLALVRAIVDATPAEGRTNILINLLKTAAANWKIEKPILSAITSNEKVSVISYLLSKEAAKQGDQKNNIGTMLNMIDVNTKDDDGNTIIHKAMQDGSSHVINKLSEVLYKHHNANIDITIRNKSGQTALDLAQTKDQKQAILSSQGVIKQLSDAVRWSDIPNVQKFLVAGCDVNTKYSNIPLICSATNIPMLRLLIVANADMDATDFNDNTALVRATRSAADRSFIESIQETEIGRKKEKSHRVDESSLEFQLFKKVLTHDLEAVKSLITSGGEVNSKNFYNDTLLNVATRLSDAKMVQVLLEKGADPTIEGRWEDTALQIAKEYGNKEVSALLDLHLKQTPLGLLAHSTEIETISHSMDGFVTTKPQNYTTTTTQKATHDKLGNHQGHTP